MKTNMKRSRLVAQSIRIGMAAVAVAFAASGFAQPTSGSSTSGARTVRSKNHKDCYVMLSSSPFPQPAERLGSTPSTASPMDIIGEAPLMHCRK
jgi:hypothetical protein